RRSLQVSNKEDSTVRKIYALCSMSLRELGRTDEAKATLLQGQRHYPDDPEIAFHLGHLASHSGRHREAKAQYLRVLREQPEEYYSSIDMGILGYKTFHNLGAVCAALNEYAEARSWFLKAMEQAPEFLPSAFALFDLA